MSNPRTGVDFTGIGGLYATYKIDNSTITYDSTKLGGSAQVGLAVTLSNDATVALCADAEGVVGRLESVQADNRCTVQVGGYMHLPGGSSAALTRGNSIIGALGASSAKGYIRDVASGAAAEIVKGKGKIHDKSDTTAVAVLF